MANRTRYTANLVSANNLYVDTVNDRLGVGTTTPDDKLHVVGNLRVTGAFIDSSGDAGDTGQFLASTITGTNWVDSPVTIAGDDGLILYNNGGTPSGAPQAYYDDNNGRIGIGTTTPISKLQVIGDVCIGTIIDIVPYDTLNFGTLSWEGSAGQLFSITNNLTTGSIFSVNDVSGIPSMDVDANGTIQLGPYGGNIGLGTTTPTEKLHVIGNILATGTITGSSDIKFKTNIQTIPNALDKVLQLRGVEFDRIDMDGEHQIGVIAQEVEKIIPEVVYGEDGTKSVAYGNIVAVLIEAIKELTQRVIKLENK